MRSKRNGTGLLISGGLVLGGLMFIAFFAPLLSSHDPNAINLARRLDAPSLAYPLGTDALGRCLASRLFHGAAVTLGAGIVASVLAFIPGLLLGLAAGLRGGRTDRLLMGIVDAALAFPGLVLAMALAGFLRPSMFSVILGLSLAGWPWWARLIRGLTLEALEKEFVQAGKVIGIGPLRLVTHYILPQIFPPLWVSFAIRTGGMLAGVSGLGYLGLGAQPPTPEWGRMLEESRHYLAQAPWLMLAPGIFLSLSIAGFNLLAEGLRDRLALRRASDLAEDE